jgi:hypothetical protein
MKIKTAMRRLNSFVLGIGLISVFGVGCSGSQKEDADNLEATEESPAEEPKAEAVEETTEEAAATADPKPVAEVSTPSATTGSVDKNRVVRYVNADEGIIRGQPNDTAEQVGRLQKGDMILVVEENGWCKISENMFIKADVLTSKAVARKRVPATWNKPAH